MAWLAFFNFYLVVKVFNTLDYQGFNFKVSKMNQVWVTGDAVVDLIPESETSLLKC
ncbi:aminoimidazole riboside kinase, partial [Vibrio parahaemolyticus]|nr:aminoimidazole riboside kinase [Vibrio parahaemolyticus]